MSTPEKSIICPFCLTEMELNKYKEKNSCLNEKCKKELPAQYVEKYEKAPPLFMQVIGGTGVGKSMYLRSLTLMLMQANKLYQADYAYAPLTLSTRTYMRNVRDFLKFGEIRQTTSSEPELPYMMLLLNMDRWENQTLVISDFPGQNFEGFYFQKEYAPYIAHEETSLLMISLHDLKESNIEMDDLMSSYIETIVRHEREGEKKSRQVVVVLSKADLIFRELPEDLRKHLEEDKFLKVFEGDKSEGLPLGDQGMEDYMQELQRISDEIEKWLKEKYLSGRNLIALAQANNIKLRFTLVSSLNQNVDLSKKNDSKQRPSQGTPQPQFEIRPRRVLDPLFWLLDLKNSKRQSPDKITPQSQDAKASTEPTDSSDKSPASVDKSSQDADESA